MDQKGRLHYALAGIDSGTTAITGVWSIDSKEGAVRLMAGLDDIAPIQIRTIEARLCVF